MATSSRRPVVVVAGLVVALALVSMLASSTATYDPWAWIVWGREITQGDLSTVDGPSWKPLPVLVTTIAAPLGSIAPDVWVVTARIGAISAVVLAFALGRRTAGALGGLLAAAPLLFAPWFFWHGWLANSEGLLVAFVLAAILAELDHRRGLAMTWGVAAGLLRPEAWPFLLLYAAWVAWQSDLRGRLAVLGGLAVLPLTWLPPEKWGSGDYWRASTRAQNPDPGAPALTAHPWQTILGNFARMLPMSTWIVLGLVLLFTAAILARRPTAAASPPDPGGPAPPIDAGPPAPSTATGRRGALGRFARTPWAVVAALAVFGLAWLVLVAIMTERGYSGNERYLIQPAALLIVAIGSAAGLVLARIPSRARTGLAALAVVGFGVAAVLELPDRVRAVLYEGRLVHDLPRAIEAAGGAERLERCGGISTLNLMVPQVAWVLREHAVDIKDAKFTRTPVVLRLRLLEDDIMRPTLARAPARPLLARTTYWQIEATDCPATPGRTR